MRPERYLARARPPNRDISRGRGPEGEDIPGDAVGYVDEKFQNRIGRLGPTFDRERP